MNHPKNACHWRQGQKADPKVSCGRTQFALLEPTTNTDAEGASGGVNFQNLEQRMNELEKALALQRVSHEAALGRVELVLALMNEKITKIAVHF
jgi:hypothetical protein